MQHVIESSGQVKLPLTWRALHVEQGEDGTVIYAERRGVVGIAMELIGKIVDRLEEPFRKHILPRL